MKIPPGKTIDDLPRIDLDEYITGIIRNFHFENQWYADRVLKKHYETTFGIFDHRHKLVRIHRPWSGMAHLPSNSPGKHYDVEFLLDKYENNHINLIMHITFHEYCMYPPHKMLEIDEKCRKLKEARDRVEEARRAAEANATKDILNPKNVNGMPKI